MAAPPNTFRSAPPGSGEDAETKSAMMPKRVNSLDENAVVEHRVEVGDSEVTLSAPTPVKKMLSEALAKQLLLSDEESCSDDANNSLCDHTCDPSEFDNIEWDKISPPGSKMAGSTPKSSHHMKEEVSLTIPLSGDLKYSYFSRGAMCVTYLGSYNDEQVVLKTVLKGCKHYTIAVNDIEHCLLHPYMCIPNALIIDSHENIVSLKGAGFSEANRFILLEFLPGGTLTQWIHDDKEISLMKILDSAIGVCSAISYLHDMAIPGRIVIHRDLKPDNLVFARDGTLKIIDFGLGKVIRRKYRVRSTYYEMTGGTGSLRYMAPEVANHKKYNEKVDVYSLGLILWEMLARVKPFQALKRKDFYERVVYNNERPSLDQLDCPEQLMPLMEKAWHPDPDTRLAAREMLGSLQAVAEEENQKSFLELNQLKLEMIDSSMVDEQSASSVFSESNLGKEKTGSDRRQKSVDLSYTQTILAKEKDYVPKFRFSRLRKGLGSKGSNNSTASISSTSEYDDRNSSANRLTTSSG